jgi:hypothetical protein
MSLILDFQKKPESYVNLGSIKVLSLCGCSEWVTDAELSHLCEGGILECARLFRCWRLTDLGIARLVKMNGSTLKRLELSGCTQLTDESLRLISINCEGLLELDLTRCPRISDVGINFIASGRLESILLYADAQLGNSSYLALSHCKLRQLDLCGHSNLSNSDIIQIMETSGGTLEYLNLSWCTQLTDALVEFIIVRSCLSKIRYLSFFGIKNLKKIDQLIIYLQNVTSLRQLDLRGIPAAFHLTSNDCADLRNALPMLEEWKLHH